MIYQRMIVHIDRQVFHKTHSRIASIRIPNHHNLPLIVCMVFLLVEFPHKMLRLSKIRSTTCVLG